jgi:3-dehydroquinate synthase
MRGVRFIQIPTSLLAQVDSSVGGKVGIDLDCGKNLVGAFYPPIEVRLAEGALTHLPLRQFVNGMGEVWKYGAIMDAALFAQLLQKPPRPNDGNLSEIVRRCIALKAYVVQEDEFETTGLRAILNFGHTVAHAVEILTGYGPVLHGEAVAIGMVAESKLGERIGVTKSGTTSILQDALVSQGLPIYHEVLEDWESMLSAMRRDKKVVGGRLAFSLLTEIGGCKLIEGVDEADVRSVLSES